MNRIYMRLSTTYTFDAMQRKERKRRGGGGSEERSLHDAFKAYNIENESKTCFTGGQSCSGILRGVVTRYVTGNWMLKGKLYILSIHTILTPLDIHTNAFTAVNICARASNHGSCGQVHDFQIIHATNHPRLACIYIYP